MECLTYSIYVASLTQCNFAHYRIPTRLPYSMCKAYVRLEFMHSKINI